MDYDKMISIIVDEVMNRLKETPKINNCNKKAVIFQEGDLNYFRDFLEDEYDVISYDENIKDCDIIIIPKLSLGMMANLANLNVSNSKEKFIIDMIMRGKKIYIIEQGMEYRFYKDTAPKQLYNKYLSFEKQLINYGIEILNESFKHNIDIQCKSEPSSNSFVSSIEDENISKKVITEDDIRKLHIKGENLVVVGEKSILTPLAKDFIKMNHMEIIKRNG